jgi:uncharacterized membrane protein
MKPKPVQNGDEPIAQAIRRNIETIARLEREFDLRRTAKERAADAIGGFTGTITFVVVHAAIFSVWILGNKGLIPGFPVFDKYPFMLLNVAVSLEAIFLSTFVLIKQERMSRRADQRAQLDLQINLLSEREMTAVLQMLQRISQRLGVHSSGREVEELAEETPVEALANQIHEHLPDE